MGKMKELYMAEMEEDREFREAEEAAEAGEAAYEAARARGEICPGCDCSKKPEDELCQFCAGGSVPQK